MYDSEKVYGDGFFRKRGYLRWRAPLVCGTIAERWAFDSVMDVGCGNGDLVAGFAALGKDSYGLEGSSACLPYAECPRERVEIHDLRRPIPAEHRRYDLVTCFEVGEHLEPEFGGVFIDNLCALSDQLVTSISGDGGRYHLHVHSRAWWTRKFEKRGYTRDLARELDLLQAWVPFWRKTGVRCYVENLICFIRR